MSIFYCTSHGRLEDSDFVGYEVTNAGEEFCEEGYAEMFDEDGEPAGSHDLSDDADALASAGFGTDEDYGYYGDDF
jgi:hypothetical protein